MCQQTNSLTTASPKMGLSKPCSQTQLLQPQQEIPTLCSHLALVLSHHSNGSSSNGSADWRSWDNAAQWCAHIYCQYEAFTHRLHILRTELQQYERLFVLSDSGCCLLWWSVRSCGNKKTYHKTLVKGRVHCFEYAAVWVPFCFTLVALTSFVVLWSQEYAERVDLCLSISKQTSNTLTLMGYLKHRCKSIRKIYRSHLL